MVHIAVSDARDAKQQQLAIAQAEAPEFEEVHWLSDPGLRKLYFWCGVLCVASATTGYDGYVTWIQLVLSILTFTRMMLNTSQGMDNWQTYFNTPTGSTLGLMNSIYQIGSLVAFPIV